MRTGEDGESAVIILDLEDPESFAGIGDPGALTLTVPINDQPDTLSFRGAGRTVEEGQSRRVRVRSTLATGSTDVVVAVDGDDRGRLWIAAKNNRLRSTSDRLTLRARPQASTSFYVGVIDDETPAHESAYRLRLERVPGGSYGLENDVFAVTVPANDPPTLSIAPDALELMEGGSATIAVGASTTPIDVVAVSLSAPVGGSLSAEDLSPNLPLRIELSPQRPATEITVAAVSDNLPELPESGALALRKLSGFAEVAATLALSIPANDTPTLSIAPDALELMEGGSATIAISASATPIDVVAVSLSAPVGGSLSAEDLSPNLPLRIELSPQRPVTEITVAAVSDNLPELPESGALALRRLSGFAEVAATLALSIPANDTPALTVSPRDGLRIYEGATELITVAIPAAAPGASL